jgi:Uncharacterized protein conserved in bacteria (DUF2125)
MVLFRTAHSAALIALLLSLPASAVTALTAEEVWADWQRLAKAGGIEITATTRRQRDRLVVTNIAIPVGPPSDAADLKLGRLDLLERPDGTVAVLLPRTFPMTFDLREADPEFDLATLSVSAPDFSMIIAGIGEQAAVDLSVPSLVVSLEKVVPSLRVEDRLDVNFAIADLTLKHSMDLTAATKTVTSSLRLGTMHGDMLFDVEPAEEKITMSVDVSSVVGALNAVVPPSVEDLAALEPVEGENSLLVLLKLVSDGLAVNGELSHGPYAMRMDAKEPDQYVRVELSSASGHAKAKFDAEALVYDLAMGKTAMVAEGNLPDMEYPDVRMSVAELGYSLSLGIGDLVTPQEVRLKARLVDLTLPAEAWAEIDPTGSLGVTPLSYGLDVSAHYALGPEMFDPDWMPSPDVPPPIDLVDATLTEMMFSGFGMTLGGSGALTFDESDLTTFDGFPAPEGKVSFQATGVNALIDRLAKSGLVAEDELTGFRFALALIAKAGETPDSLVSNVEFKDKTFYLNGLKIR